MSETPILELKNISKNFRTIQALDHVDFDLREGEVHALVGENGAGKSTLMRILAGIYTDYEGTYTLDGKEIHLHTPGAALEHGIGMIHQELSTIPPLSVAENLFLGRQPVTRLGAIDWGKMRRVAQEQLHTLGFDLDPSLPLELYSLGTQQVVEVLRTIMSGARVLIMDEPTSALSPAEVEQLMGLVDTLRQQKRSIIYISHFLEEVLRVADRITVLRNGSKIATLERKDASMDKLISLILGREVGQILHTPDSISQPTEHLLQVQDLNADVFTNIDLSVGKGEIVGLYGAIGAGHFDLARALFGLYKFDSGTITLAGKPFPRNHSARYAIRNGLAYATESRRKSLLLEPIYRNVTMPHLERIGRVIPQRRQELAAAVPALKKVNVQPPDPVNPVGKLSGGNQQKVAIARWLPFPPKVFIMSEPTRGMDVGAKSEVMSILRQFRDEGYGVLVVSSEPETILAVTDRVVVMSHGKIVARMENRNLDKDTLMRLL
ncbi:MAG TPA: sugar ABC transporter ATP-binding protein [Aggregatilinea sp.]|uniref:sugar ABC transporter ATP-binding protein n=1 Tax=Aggregatilinea sp. TaxID=2806333 RepID=UPI002CA5C60E|nr:sugar ABC transporter ATP-binding protein [Aggregatilinea sp.]HML21422.1 sugar ABC transporter ATP-binding protein [Aggregatilinea sp.]